MRTKLTAVAALAALAVTLPTRPARSLGRSRRAYLSAVALIACMAAAFAPVLRAAEMRPSRVERPYRTAKEEANLVVTRFLLAAALGDRRTACALFTTYIPCESSERFLGPADFNVVSITVADPKQPVVVANVEGIRGYFVLERAGRSFRIVRAAVD